MSPEQFAIRLQSALPAGLRSVVLFGSAAAGDFIPAKSRYDLLVVADRWSVAELKAVTPAAMEWMRDGNEAPLLFTAEQLKSSADAFPIELADIRQSRKTLFGDDLLAAIEIDMMHLRLQLERELKGKLLLLLRHYLQTGGDSDRIVTLMTTSLSTFLVLFRGALRLFQPHVPDAKFDALAELARQISCDPQPFLDVHKLKTGERLSGDFVAAHLFADYSNAVEQVVDAVDRHIHTQSP